MTLNKTWLGREIREALILIESSEKLDIKEINFLINFSEEVSKLAANIGVKSSKRQNCKREGNYKKLWKEHKNSEELIVYWKLAQLIISQTAEEKLKACRNDIKRE